MPIVIALYFLAGSLLVGGPAAGKYVYDVARREAARDLLRRDRQALVDALHGEVDLANLRHQAAAAGLDPDVVVQGYTAVRDGRMDLDQLLAMLQIL